MQIYNGPRIAVPSELVQSRHRFCARAQGTGFDVHAAGDVTEIDLYHEIGYWGIDARQFRAMLRDAGDVRVRINSPGGDVYDGITMYNDLNEHRGQVTVQVPGIAASAASIIAMAADPGRLHIASSGFVMVHNAWALCVGNRHDMSDVAGVLDQIDGAMNDLYKTRTGLDGGEISDYMDAETWFRGADAVDAGFADAVYDEDAETAAAARFDLSSYHNAPRELLAQFSAQSERICTRKDLERKLTRDAGLTRSQARAICRGDVDGMLGAAAAQGDTTRDAGDSLKPFINLLEEIKNGT